MDINIGLNVINNMAQRNQAFTEFELFLYESLCNYVTIQLKRLTLAVTKHLEDEERENQRAPTD